MPQLPRRHGLRMQGRLPVAALALAALWASGAGCAGSESREQAAVRAAGASSAALFESEAMRRARLHRERGSLHMEQAYASRRSIDREAHFRAAMHEFAAAENAYHDALLQAPAHYHPVIEGEIEQVAAYMRQIQRDAASPLAPPP